MKKEKTPGNKGDFREKEPPTKEKIRVWDCDEEMRVETFIPLKEKCRKAVKRAKKWNGEKQGQRREEKGSPVPTRAHNKQKGLEFKSEAICYHLQFF